MGELWTMENGYALASQSGLEAISVYLATLTSDQRDELSGLLRIGLLSDAEVTEAVGPDRLLVSQAFCSALPVAYSDISPDSWGPFAQLVLDAAYEATLCAAVLNARRGASHVVFLTLLGGGAFGNHTNWILSAIQRALGLTRHYDLDVRLVSYGAPSNELVAAIRTF